MILATADAGRPSGTPQQSTVFPLQDVLCRGRVGRTQLARQPLGRVDGLKVSATGVMIGDSDLVGMNTYGAPNTSGRDRADLWTAAATCPRFHQDRNAFMLLEDKIRADRLQEIYVRELLAAQRLDADPSRLNQNAPYELVTSPTELRLFSALATYLHARENNLIMIAIR